MLFFCYSLEVFSWDVGDGDGGDAIDGDDDAEVLLHAFEHSFDALELAVIDPYLRARLEGKGGIVQEHDMFVVVERGHVLERCHLGLWDADDYVVLAVLRGTCHIAQRLETLVGMLQLGYPLLCGMYEYQVVDSRDLPQFFSCVCLHPFVFEGQECLDAKAVQLVPQDELAAVGYPHGEPGCFIAVHRYRYGMVLQGTDVF